MSSRKAQAERIRELLATEGEAVEANTRTFNRGRYQAVAELEAYETLKERARAIKEDAIADLPALIDEVTEAIESRGGHVHLAGDAADANEYILDVAAKTDAEVAVKSKSMTSEEIEVNDALEEAGVDVWETDLGEFVLQVADEEPSHLVGPAIHHTPETIAALFEAQFEPDEPFETAQDLTRFAREFLADRIREADLGMTGANFVAADTGTIALVTSEGNARKTVAGTDVHVAVAGVEKLIPSVADLEPFVELLARSAIGENLSAYLTLLTPPVDAPTLDFEADSLGDPDDREFHLVLLDNGRLEMREDEHLRETLYCVRCGACANTCANFQHVGGHAFGGETYTGGIATGWEAGVHGEESAGEFNDLCTGCSRCVEACPVKIDIPWINTVVRDRINHGADPNRFDHLVDGLAPDAEPSGTPLQKRAFGNVETAARLASATAPASNWLANLRPTRWLLDELVGIDPRRELPHFRRHTFRDWFEDRGGSRVPDADASHQVALYPDLYTNYVQVERGKAAVRVLEALDVAVEVPSIPESGRAPLSQGMVATAEAQAEAVAEALKPHLDAGKELVVVEPSDLAMFRRDYGKLLPAAEAERITDASYEILEYVYRLLADGAGADQLREGTGELAYHPHCQARTLGLAPATVEVLGAVGYDVALTDAECCGMAGSFGYKSQYYELSVGVGETLAEQLRAGELDDREVVASGTSCLEQLDGLLEQSPRHPVELLAP